MKRQKLIDIVVVAIATLTSIVLLYVVFFKLFTILH